MQACLRSFVPLVPVSVSLCWSIWVSCVCMYVCDVCVMGARAMRSLVN